jgi:spermidine synthase
MGGLALGSALAGKLAPRIRKPLATYGWIEIGIAAYALLVPLLFRLIDQVYVLIWQQFQPGFFAFSLWRFVLSSLVLLVPTTLMGATLPVLAAALVHSTERNSNSVTRLYACNLAGAILGTLTAGFVLLPVLGVRATILVAAVMNVIRYDQHAGVVDSNPHDDHRVEYLRFQYRGGFVPDRAGCRGMVGGAQGSIGDFARNDYEG